MDIKVICIPKAGVLRIKYDAPNPNTPEKTDHFVLESGDPPIPEFRKALEAVGEVAMDILNLPDEYSDLFGVVKVAIKEQSVTEAMGVVIEAEKAFEGLTKVAKLVTPDLYESTGDDDEEGHLSKDQVEAISELIVQAEKYVKGERKQGTLGLNDPEPEDEEE